MFYTVLPVAAKTKIQLAVQQEYGILLLESMLPLATWELPFSFTITK
jgi:hypothetical protein